MSVPIAGVTRLDLPSPARPHGSEGRSGYGKPLLCELTLPLLVLRGSLQVRPAIGESDLVVIVIVVVGVVLDGAVVAWPFRTPVEFADEGALVRAEQVVECAIQIVLGAVFFRRAVRLFVCPRDASG
jgi:hypothetical protein